MTWIGENLGMRCFYVLVHGNLEWLDEQSGQLEEADNDRPSGFYCHRFVLASDECGAKEKAFRRVRENLERQTGWLGNNQATLELDAPEVAVAPMLKALAPDDRGHTFY